MDDEFEWKEYTNEMLSKGISIIYDASGDYFLAKPVAFKENKMSNNKKLRKENYDSTLSVEVGDSIAWVDEYGERQRGTVIDDSDPSIISVYNSLTGEVEDLTEDNFNSIRILNRVDESKRSKKKINEDDRYLLYDDEEEIEDDIDLESSHDDLVSLSAEDLSPEIEGEEIDTEFDSEEVPVEPINTGMGVGQVTLEDLQRIVSEIMSGQGSGSQVQVEDKFYNGEVETVDQSSEPTNDILGSEFAETQEDVANVESKIESEGTYLEYLQGNSSNEEIESSGQEFEIYEEPEEVDIPSNVIEEDDDLEILSPADYEDGDFDTPEVKGPAKAVEPGSSIDCRGIPVKVQITGWLITVPEVNNLAEAVFKSGGKLRALGSKNTQKLTLVVEANKKLYKILYEDRSKTETQKPWSVGKVRFTSLTEAVKNINKVKITDKDRFFKKLISENKDLVNRGLSNLKESDIFEDFKDSRKDYVSAWNVKSVGQLDLKKGLNETYSNITEGSKSKNTLFKTKSGQYYLLKGNLGEGSQKGTKKELIDLEGKRNYGHGQVVGIYENSIKGLGQIMFKIKRTSVPLMVWKQRY